MKKLLLNFVDMWPGFDYRNEIIYQLLCRHYDIEISDRPDYVICETFGHDHLKYDCVKILVLGENLVPDFNLYDYAIGFDHLQFGDRFLRVPLFAFYPSYRRGLPKKVLTDEQLLNRGFCSFVVSNNKGDPLREEFFHRLSRYKRVDSGGRFLNNVGGPVNDKIEFCRKYKFNIAFENSASPGYTTEKIMEPLMAESVPIYYGNPKIEEDVNADCLVRVKGRQGVDEAIERIIALDRDDEKYLEKCHAPGLLYGDSGHYDEQLMAFFNRIFSQPPVDAKRVIAYGCQNRYREELKSLFAVQGRWGKIDKLCRRVLGK